MTDRNGKATRQAASRNRGGRPSKYDPAHCETVIALGGKGSSRTAMACAPNVAQNTLKNWSVAHPEFAEALEFACDTSQAWWEDRSR